MSVQLASNLAGLVILVVACGGAGAVPGDRPTVDGCVEWFNEHDRAGAADVVGVFVSAQAAHEWNGDVPVCWVTLFEPECAINHAMGPDWTWQTEPLPGGDCDQMRLSVDVGHRLVGGRLISR